MALSNGGVLPNLVPIAHAQQPIGAGFTLNAGDLRFIFRQIQIAQNHSAGNPLFGLGPNQVPEARFPWGLRTVDGSFNHLDNGNELFGASDQIFPRMTTPIFKDADSVPASLAALDGPGGLQGGEPTSYQQLQGFVSDRDPRLISNLVADQTVRNPAAVEVAGPEAVEDPLGTLPITNVAPDAGLSAGFNGMLTFFGQFFDHGLDLVNKGGNGTVFIPLQPDDPLFTPGGANFMMLTRATVNAQHEAVNQTTPFVDQNQTYTSHPSHQAFLREYALDSQGRPQATGRLIDGPGGNIGNWNEVKAQAKAMLGIVLVDADVNDVPKLVTDPYGHLIRNDAGFPMAMLADGVTTVALVPGGSQASSTLAKTNHQFLNDIAHHAAPNGPPDDDNIASEVINGVITPPQQPGTYDDELLGIHFITGDGRGNENIALTAVHQVFHLEHNRLQSHIHGLIHSGVLTPEEVTAWETTDPASDWDYGERLFQASRFVTEMQYQHLVFEEFARKLAPSINAFIGDGLNFVPAVNPAIKAEFAHQTYRLGHSMLNESIGRKSPAGVSYDIPLLDGFLNPAEFNRGANGQFISAAEAAGAIFQGTTEQLGQEIDEFVTEAVRNRLLGLPLDLAVLNLARGRSEGVAPLNKIRAELFTQTGDFALMPYLDWFDFSFNIRHPESLVNFIAAYGQHPTLNDPPSPAAPLTQLERRVAAAALIQDPNFMFQPAASSGVDDIDLWIGGLAEKPQPFGGLLGPTFNYVFELQLESLQNADRFYYLERLDGLNLLSQMEANSFGELISRNTTLAGAAADVFSRPGLTFNLSAQNPSGPIVDDPQTPWNETTLLVRMPNGAIRYPGPEHVTFNGSPNGDRLISSEGDDTLRGNEGNDVMEGGAGNDNHLGGPGDDILTDTFGDDVIKGGPGNDAISGGSGPFDLLQGNDGNDFIVGGNDESEVFGGIGNDIIYMGAGLSESVGGAGDDWMEGTQSPASIAIGDDNNQFQNDPNGGNDILLAGPGDMDFDSEGGDDILVGNVMPTHRFEGMLGFDWATYRGETVPVDADMLITGAFQVNAPLNEGRDRYDLLEGLSGTQFNDLLRGDDRDAAALADDGLTGVANGHVLSIAGINRITGLAALLPAGNTAPWGEGNIILGGAGSDILEGRGGNDIIDGDAWLNVQLQAPGRNPANSLHELKADVFAGLIAPGSITFLRFITTQGATPQDIDTAVFTGPSTDYSIVTQGGFVIVTDNVGTDGVDRLRNVERLQFADGTIVSPVGTVGRNVPNVVNQLQAQATTALTNQQFQVSVTTANSATVAVGRVISQSPAGGTQAAVGSTVGIVVSLGPVQVVVPNVVGTTLAGATTALNGAGFTLTSVVQPSATVPAGSVISQVPAGGTTANAGSVVALVVSGGVNPQGLVAAFGFEETTGNVINDSSTGPMNGTLAAGAAAPTRVALGKIGRALSFDGGDSASVVDATASKLDLTNGMTLEAWVNPSSMNGWESVVYKERGGAGTGLLSYALYAHDGGTNTPPAGYVRTSAGGPDRGITAASRLPLNVWSHIAVTYTTAAGGSTLRIYVNGVLINTVAGPNQNMLVANNPLRIGNSNASISEGFNGMLDEVRIYNRALSAAEILVDMTTAVVFGTPVVP